MSRLSQLGTLNFSGVSMSEASGQTDYYQANMIFAMASAPLGWVQQTTYNDYALRVVSGTPTVNTTNSPFSTVYTPVAASGSVPAPVSSNFTPAIGPITIGSTTLTYAQLPPHTHTMAASSNSLSPSVNLVPSTNAPGPGSSVFPVQAVPPGGLIVANPPSIPTTTSGHTHGSSTTVATLNPFVGNSTSLAIQYIDNIIAQYQK